MLRGIRVQNLPPTHDPHAHTLHGKALGAKHPLNATQGIYNMFTSKSISMQHLHPPSRSLALSLHPGLGRSAMHSSRETIFRMVEEVLSTCKHILDRAFVFHRIGGGGGSTAAE